MANKKWEITFHQKLGNGNYSGGTSKQVVEAVSAPEAQKRLLAMYNGNIKISNWREVK